MNPHPYIQIIIATLAIYLLVIIYVRINGLRSFAKMSSFDFAMTIAVGSIIASVSIGSVGIVEGAIAIGTLFIAQAIIAFARRRLNASKLVDNQPLILMKNGQLIQANLDKAMVTTEDVAVKLREANVSKVADVQYVILETTGNISVLQGARVDDALLRGVKDLTQCSE